MLSCSISRDLISFNLIGYIWSADGEQPEAGQAP